MSELPPELREALGGQWSVLGEYGGGQGHTWRIADPAGREFAFKVLAAGEQAVEVSALSSLRHPAIPTVHEVGRLADGRVFVLREHVGGEVPEVLPRAPEVLLPIVQQLLEVLAFVHLRGIRHLDLKPRNLVIDERGRLHLLDFGLSVRGGASGRGGTPFYAAPELLLGAVPDHRADLFSVGAMIAQALWGDRQWSLVRFVERFPADDFFVAAGV
ncbi:MAG: protein kinase, partial [Planctomycetes bacterium]|nr:protein kinase [Planctomycetota bacterium]